MGRWKNQRERIREVRKEGWLEDRNKVDKETKERRERRKNKGKERKEE